MVTGAVPPISCSLLGSFEVHIGTQHVSPTLERKTRALLAYLAATNRSHSRQTLFRWFCQEANNPAGNLRWHLSRIRHQLGSQVLVSDGGAVYLNRQIVRVDCDVFLEAMEVQAGSMDALTDALDLYRGRFLEDLTLANAPEFEFWLLGERARYSRLYQRGLFRLVELLIAAGRYEKAIERAQCLVQADPLLEEAHVRLSWLYARLGQREAALEQFQRCSALLRRELAVEPTPAFIQLHKQILRDELYAEGPSGGEEFQAVQMLPKSASGPFVGRDVELDQLHQAWQAARSQKGMVVVIEGVAGCGKTRLLQEFRRQVPEALFLAGQCYESTSAMPYRPWSDLLQACLDVGDEEDLKRVAPYYLAQLTRLLPDLLARSRLSSTAFTSPFPGEQEHLFAAVVEFLLCFPDNSGKKAPLLLFVDDLQWADEASLRLFHFLAQRLQRPSGRPVMLLGAFRSEETDDYPALLTLVSDLRRTGTLVTFSLSALEPASVEDLIASLWPDLLPGERALWVRDTLIKATGGNPLFVTEVLRALAHTNVLPARLPLPPSLHELIQGRLRHLSDSGRQVIEALAVLDVPATLGLARQISGRSEEETTAAIDQGLRWGLLQLVREAQSPCFMFSHDLMREAVVVQVSAARSQRLHRRAAAALEQSSAPGATLAYHWRMAGDAHKEMYYAALAGEGAAAVYANDEAARYFQRALELCRDPLRRVELMHQLGEVWRLTGKWANAEAIYQEALKEALLTRDREIEARSRVRLGRLMIDRGAYLKALPFFEEVICLDGAGIEKATMCQALGGMAAVYLGQGKFRDVLAYNERQYGLASELHERVEMSEALGNMGLAYMHLEDYPRAVQCIQEKLHLASALDQKQQVGLALRHLAALYQSKLFEYHQAWSCYERLLPLYQEIGDIPGLAITLNNLTILYLDLGAYDDAIVCAERHLQVSLDLGSHLDIALALAHIGQAWLGQGEARQAEPIYTRAFAVLAHQELPYFFGMNLIHAARVYEAVGAFDQVQPLANKALRLAHISSQLKQVEFPALILEIRARLALRQLDISGALCELELLAADWPHEAEQATLHDEIQRLHPDIEQRQQHSAMASALYGDLYRRTHLFQYRQRYEALTGEILADLALLPAPPPFVTLRPFALERLLAQVDHLISG